jgi:phosphoglycerate kinase
VQTLDDLSATGVAGQGVLLRADLNVPLDGKTITDDGRVRASVPTIRRLTEAGATVIVVAHLGRPKGEPEDKYSLAPVADRLGELLGMPVALAGDVTGPSAREKVRQAAAASVVLLENVRFDPRETSQEEGERRALAAELAELAGQAGAPGTFVSDGFGVLHRKQASVYDVATMLPCYAGELVRAEVGVLRTLLTDPERPYAVVLGGSKVSDKLEVISALLGKVDHLLVGGGMCFTFLAAQGYTVGESLVETDMVETCGRLAGEAGAKLRLPADVVVAAEVTEDAAVRTVAVEAIPEGRKGLDIGPATVREFAAVLGEAATVFWNGPMGVFEVGPFASGTEGVAKAIASSEAYSVVGGGDSASAVRALGIPAGGFSHISTGGGASLEFLEGKHLPGIDVLEGGGS